MTKVKILVVDDDADTRVILGTRLKKLGYLVLYAADSYQAISMARQEAPGVILLDIGLPGGNGFIVLERLKAMTTLADIPVIVVSSQDADAAEARAIEAGAVLYLQKPVDQDQILSALHTALPS
jgi:CheY-like chemotaxis protein